LALSTLPTTNAGLPPNSEVGTWLPIAVPCRGEVPGSSPSSRLSQPLRSVEPGAASSMASIAAKCERFGVAMPVAWTAASVPASHIGSSGASAGCRPNIASGASSAVCGTPMRGRAA
jgi:hypothetical protein